MNVFITISNVGTDAGPFNLYSDLDGYTSAFETNIPKEILEAGYATNSVPDGTKEVRVQSVNEKCNTFVNKGSVPLTYYFIPSPINSGTGSGFTADFIDRGTYALVYGTFSGYHNGSYIVPGNHLVKLNPDKTVDTSFDITEGFSEHLVYIGATMTELFDGSVIVVGYFTSFNGQNFNRIIKLDADGTVNPAFDLGGGFNDYTTGISETVDGKYYISGIYSRYKGFYSPRIIRLLPDGSRDPVFNVGDGFNNASLSTLVNFDNSVFVTGYFTNYNGTGAPGIMKIKPDGTVDSSFVAGAGFQPRGTYKGVLMARIPGEDSIVCVSYCAYCGGSNLTTYQGVNYGNIVKLELDGSVNTEFAANSGTGFNGECGLIDIVFGDKILVTATAPQFTEYNGVSTIGMAVLNSDGTLHKAFPVRYGWVYTIGNTMYGTDPDDPDLLNQVIYEYDPLATTTTTSTLATTTTTTTV